MHKEVTFADFTKDWYLYDQCPYIQSKLRRGGDFSRSNAMKSRRQLEMYIIPFFGTLSLIDITPIKIEEWLISMKNRKLKHTSINQYFKTFKLIMKEAHRLNIIPDNPAVRVLPFIEKPQEKGILTEDEVSKLFDANALESVWSGNYMHFLLNYTACKTGMRIGELLALKIDKIKENYIIISALWDRNVGEKGTKTGKTRYVPIDSTLSKMLLNFNEDRLYVFSFPNKNKPINHNMINIRFKRALEAIGITNEMRLERRITPYSWRHYRNTQLRSMGIPDHITQAIIGHSNVDMSDHYTHFQPEDLIKVLKNVSAID